MFIFDVTAARVKDTKYQVVLIHSGAICIAFEFIVAL